MTIKRTSGFRIGSGCFTCRSCGKPSRDVDQGNGAVELCPLCNTRAMNGNSLSDAGWPGSLGTPVTAWEVFEPCQSPEECDRLLTTLLALLKSEE